MAAMVTCPICADDFRPSQMVSCPSCSHETCQSCVARFIQTLSGDARCMRSSCKHPWDRAFLYRSLPPSLIYSSLKKQREEVLFDREKAMLPDTMPLIPLKIREDELKEEKKKINEMIADLKKRLSAVDLEIGTLQIQQNRIRNGGVGIVEQEKHTQDKTKEPRILCPCPQGDCRGFINSADRKCGLCSSKICSKCHVVVQSNVQHECKADDVATVDMIRKECKACPSCGVPSRKTEGCSQVWCLVCKKAWNWETRTIETGPIHATDYFHYMRNNGHAIAPVCGNHLHPANYLNNLRHNYKELFTDKICDDIMAKYQVAIEYARRVNNIIEVPNNVDLRIRYLQKDIDEKEWKKLLHKRDKEYAFKTEIHRMRVAYTQNIRDAITSLCQANTRTVVMNCLENINIFHNMMVEEYAKLAKCFSSKRKCPFDLEN